MSFFTLTPFLYQTRTILRLPPPHRASAAVARSLHATARRPGDIAIPFDYEVGPPGEHAPVADTAPRGTITPTERQIFQRIFADIEARGLKPAVELGDTTPSTIPPSRSARLIMQQAAYDAGQARPATVTSPALLSGAARDRAKALLRFPPELRSAASKALDTINRQAAMGPQGYDAYDTHDAHNAGSAAADHAAAEEDDPLETNWKAPAHTFARTVELESKRQPERTRIEGLITSAASDFELWDVLEKEVFQMPARLGIMKAAAQSDDPDPSAKPKKRGRKSASKSQSPGQTSHDPDANLETSGVDASPASPDNTPNAAEPAKLSLYVHGPLYPAYLLLALRQLDTAFAVPSPLVFSILPRIKELGLESYVLGVSTPFFNELLNIYWTRRGDLSGVLNLLEEMRHCGIYFDNRTASILNQMDTALSQLATAEDRAGFGKALMLMPDYEKSQRERIRHWHSAVDISANERQHDFGFAEATSV
ncbi:hypothetical protein F5Y14DRAFT_401562 [Nemania sp. NC0429]|nr:hypothetical protein F5Y14DRAFT_401562 [Nemania sp. NC0429]